MEDKTKETIKKLFPRFLILSTLSALTYTYLKYYSLKFKPLILRENTTDIMVFRDIFVLKEFDLHDRIEPKLIIDGGAYAGYSSLYFHSRYPNAKIISVEPEDSNFQILEKNTQNITNIKRIKAGLWHKDCYLKTINRGNGQWGFMTEEADALSEGCTKGVTLNILLKESGFDRIGLLKLDIEGAEQEIFSKNYDDWLSRCDVIMIELHDRIKKDCSKAFYSAIRKYDWKEFRQGEKVFLIRKYLGKDQ